MGWLGEGVSLVRRNASSDNEGAAEDARSRRPSRKFRRPLRFRCRRPYNRRAPNSESEIVRALVAYGELLHFLAIFLSFALPLSMSRALRAGIFREIATRNCIKPTRRRSNFACCGIVDVSRLARLCRLPNHHVEYKIFISLVS